GGHAEAHGGAPAAMADPTLVLVAGGASSTADREAMAAELERLGLWAAQDGGFGAVQAIVGPDLWSHHPELREDFEAALAAVPAGAVVVPFDLAPKLDGMMQFAGDVR